MGDLRGVQRDSRSTVCREWVALDSRKFPSLRHVFAIAQETVNPAHGIQLMGALPVYDAKQRSMATGDASADEATLLPGQSVNSLLDSAEKAVTAEKVTADDRFCHMGEPADVVKQTFMPIVAGGVIIVPPPTRDSDVMESLAPTVLTG